MHGCLLSILYRLFIILRIQQTENFLLIPYSFCRCFCHRISPMEPADEYFYYCYEGFLEENWMKCSQRELAKKRQRSIARSRVLADGDKRSKIGSTLTEQQEAGFGGFEDVFEEEPQDRLFSRITSVDFDQQKAAYRPLLPSTHYLPTAHSLPHSPAASSLDWSRTSTTSRGQLMLTQPSIRCCML